MKDTLGMIPENCVLVTRTGLNEFIRLEEDLDHIKQYPFRRKYAKIKISTIIDIWKEEISKRIS